MGTNGARLPNPLRLLSRRYEARPRANLIRILQFCTLVCSAIVMGLTVTHVLQSPGSRGLSGEEWLDVQHTFYGGFAVVGAISESLGLITAISLTLTLVGRRVAPAVVAPAHVAGGFIGYLMSGWVGKRPVKAKIGSWR